MANTNLARSSLTQPQQSVYIINHTNQVRHVAEPGYVIIPSKEVKFLQINGFLTKLMFNFFKLELENNCAMNFEMKYEYKMKGGINNSVILG